MEQPGIDEVEVSIFGPGYGESVLVHLGGGDWMIVDSCLEPASQQPAALKYLKDIGVDPSQAVSTIVATHWDNDHIRGLARITRECCNARFFCTGALGDRDLKELLGKWFGLQRMPDSGIGELRNILNELSARRPSRPGNCADLASANKIVWERRGGERAEVRALSPSSSGVLATVAALRHKLNREAALYSRLPRISPNHASVVLRVEIGDVCVLLGGDLQVRDDASLGWKAVISDFGSGPRSDSYKIPHHGSENADHPEIWKQMLHPTPLCLMAPYLGGGNNLPRIDDCRRILGNTENAFITCPPLARKYRDPDSMVRRTMREVATDLRDVSGRAGQIRARRRIQGGEWSVETFGYAQHLKDCLSTLENRHT
jgi:hypothetical protein